MPRERPPRRVEEVRVIRAVRAHTIHQPVVRGHERDLHLAHEDVHVVARITDQGDAFLVPGQVAFVLEQLGGVVALEEVGGARRTPAIERLEVGAG